MNAEFITGLFDRVYVVNLVERTDRKREIAKQLTKVGLSLEDPVVYLFPACRPASKGPFPSIGARGCFMSHLGILEHAISANHESILILEDDMDWTPVALDLTTAQLSTLQQTDWDFLHGGSGNDLRGATGKDFHLKRLQPDQGVMLTHFIGMRGQTISKAHRYLSNVLKRPVGSAEGGPMHVDGAYSWFRKDTPNIRSNICVPSLARQRPSQSDVTPSSGIKALPLISHALLIARYLRKAF